jgi:hypothetical protein
MAKDAASRVPILHGRDVSRWDTRDILNYPPVQARISSTIGDQIELALVPAHGLLSDYSATRPFENENPLWDRPFFILIALRAGGERMVP